MNDLTFWKLIEDSRRDEGEYETQADRCDAQAERLATLLQTLPPDEIYDFDRHFARRRQEAYRWDLWGAAYLVNGGCSDDGFEYFRCWLIGQGQAAFERALADPESVGELVEDDDEAECEQLMYASGVAYEAVTGAEMPLAEMNYSEIVGEPWEEDDLDRLYPNLSKRFG